MIFIGEGSLLQNALNTTIQYGLTIDAVYSPNEQPAAFCRQHNIRCLQVKDVNEEKESLQSCSSDGIVFSLNNAWILKRPLLQLPGFRFYNIHNGIIPWYRGKPEICMIYALLHDEKEYGASLHEMDEKIDHGTCLSVRRFPVSGTDDFESLMIQGLHTCNSLFKEKLEAVVTGTIREQPVPVRETGTLYTYRDLKRLPDHVTNRNFARATRLGLFKDWFGQLHQAIEHIAHTSHTTF